MKSKRFEVLAARPVNQDGYVQEWPEVGRHEQPLRPQAQHQD